jgi:glucan 1,3-beta-glucosidase
MGRTYTSTSGIGAMTTGFVNPTPNKPTILMDGTGKIFEQSKPLYADKRTSDFVVVTSNGVDNDGTGDQASAINSILAANVGKPILFPAGVYMVQSTITIPVGSIIVGLAWPQIMATGSYFQDATNPKVAVR